MSWTKEKETTSKETMIHTDRHKDREKDMSVKSKLRPSEWATKMPVQLFNLFISKAILLTDNVDKHERLTRPV